MWRIETPELRPSNRPERGISRSPHPYHRPRTEIIQPDDATSREGQIAIRSSVDASKRWKEGPSSSDSGTEADDENGTFLKALPPAPLRLSKGLKHASSANHVADSPLLTPSILDEEHRRQEWEKSLLEDTNSPGVAPSDGRKGIKRANFEAKRQAELLRRVVETLLLGAVGYIACQPTFSSVERHSLYPKLLTWTIIIVSLYVLYPLRLLSRCRIERSRGIRVLPWVRVSASFDPAPLLYPVLIPVFVSLALKTEQTSLMPPIVLSIASIPRPIVPLTRQASFDYSLQWALSLVPVIVSSHIEDSNHLSGQNQRGQAIGRTVNENLSLIMPLHQSLLSALRYLTTTSLLTAELQLLSAGLISLLMLSVSPQSTILKAILWEGGVVIFIMTWRVLKWEVAIARIPAWRFRNAQFRSHRGHFWGSLFDDVVKGGLSRSATASDEPYSAIIDTFQARSGRPFNDQRPFLTKSRLDSVPRNGYPDQQGPFADENRAGTVKRVSRRHTMPTQLEAPKGLAMDLISPFSTPHRSLHRTFLRLSQTQGALVRWLIASYVYIVVLLTALVPVRLYVSRHALNGYEAVGWASGYLFGDSSFLRECVATYGLHNWIPLQKTNVDTSRVPGLGLDDTWSSMKATSPNVRLGICMWCILVLFVGLALVLSLRASVEVDTRRKVFHGMMVAMFLPTIFVDPPFISLAFAIVLPIFLVLDLFRASQMPPLSRPLTNFLAPYVDGRDHRGPVIVSHIFLLIGCAVPLWLSLAAVGRTGHGPWAGWEVPERRLSMISGVVCVGMGDAAASLIGRRFGRRRWCWSGGKSFEGSFAFLTAVVVGLCFGRWWLRAGGWMGDSGDPWAVTVLKASVAGAGASLTEAVLTGGNDNVIVPVILWLLVHGLGV